MTPLLPLLVALPLLTAGLVTALGHAVHRSLDDLAGIAVAVATTVLAAVVLYRAWGEQLVYWFGGWKPRDGIALGIAFAVDPVGAGLALLAGVLVTASLLYSWRYFDESGKLWIVLMLVFLGGVEGFALTGDLFNLFVFFELMGVAAFALAAYKVEETGPLQGAFNFAVTNSIGAFLVLIGIALLYARTGALNLAQIGRALAGHEADRLVVVAFALIVCGFLVKSAIVPFHFWLADAYAAAPIPVCVVLAGVMSDLGVYAIARIYWTVFDGPLAAQAGEVRAVLIGFGLLTAALGAAMCFLQRHLKRLLAFSTISHTGVLLVGIALLSRGGLAGVALYVCAHGLLKGALFFAVGILSRRLGSVDELELRGRGRRLPLAGATFLLGGLGLAGLPFVGTFSGRSLVEGAASHAGYGWLGPALMLTAGVSCAAILRAGGRVFLGWGPPTDPLLSPEPPEHEREGREVPLLLMRATTVGLLVAGLALSAVPGLERRAEVAAERFQDRPLYVRTVLFGHELPPVPRPPVALVEPPAESALYGLGAVALAVGIATVALRRGRRRSRALPRPVGLLRAVHSGHIGDYVAWLTAGTATMGVLFAFLLR